MPTRVVEMHRLGAKILLVFLTLHFCVHLSALAGPDAHIWALRSARRLYGYHIVEGLLALGILGHVSAGLILLRRVWRYPKTTPWRWLQMISGLYLAYFLIAHTAAALTTRYVFNLETHFFWAAGPLHTEGLRAYFLPYYSFGVAAVFVHVAAALALRRGKRAGRRPYWLAGAGLTVAFLIVSTFAGAYYPVVLPEAYRAFYQAYTAIFWTAAESSDSVTD